VIHRDLKPSNVLVMERDGEAVPKIIDFGLAKATEKLLTEETVFTEAGVLIGTPEYMSPEQASLGSVDTRTDVYSLGVLLYELLVGAVPFDSKALRSAGYDEIRRGIREDDPPTPAARLAALGPEATEIASCATEAGALRRQVRGELDWITMKALEKDCARRYPSASEMAADVQHYLRDEPVTAGPAGRAYRLRKFVRKHRAAVTAAAVIFLLLTSGLGISSSLLIRLQRQHTLLLRENYITNIGAAESDVEHLDFAQAVRRLDQCDPSTRGWEWRHLLFRLDSSQLALFGRGVSDRHAAFALGGNGGRVVWSSNETVNVWPGGSNIRSDVYGGLGEIFAINRDGGRILARPYRNPKILRIVDPVSRSVMATLALPGSDVQSAAFGPDDARVATGLRDGTLLLWDGISGSIAARVPAHTKPVVVVGFSRDGTQLVSGAQDGSLRVWSAQGLRPVRTLDGHSSSVTAVGFSPDGRRVASGSLDRTLRLWGLAEAKPVATIGPAAREVAGVSFSPDGKHLAYASAEGLVRVLETDSGRIIATLAAGFAGDVNAVSFNPDGSRLFLSSEWGEIHAWDAATWGGTLWKQNAGQIRSMAFNSDGSRVLAVLWDNLQIWDGLTGQVIARTRSDGLSDPAFSRDGTRAAWGYKTDVRIWDGTAVRTLPGHHELVTTAAFSPDGQLVASGSVDGTVRIWDARTGTTIRTLELHEVIHSVLFSPDGRQLLTVSSDLTFKLWRTTSWKLSAVLEMAPALQWGNMTGELFGGTDPVFSPDSRRIVCGFNLDKKMAIWDSHSGRLLGAVPEGALRVMGFSPDGKRFLSISDDDGTMRLWDAEWFRVVLTLRDDKGLRWAGFTPDGGRIFSASADGTVRAWGVRSSRTFKEAFEKYLELAKNLDVGRSGFRTAADVERFVENDQSREAPVRQTMLEYLKAHGDLDEIDTGAVWDAVKLAGSSERAYREAFATARRLTAVEPSNGEAWNALGAAQYRLGEFQEALATLDHCQDVGNCPSGRNTAFLTMAHFRLGHVKEARDLLEQLRGRMRSRPGAPDPDLQALLREAESVAGGR